MPSHLKGLVCNIYRDLLASNWIENTCVQVTKINNCCFHLPIINIFYNRTQQKLWHSGTFPIHFQWALCISAVFGTSKMKQTSEATEVMTRTTFWPPKSVSAAANHAFQQSNTNKPHNWASHIGSCYANQGRLRPPQTAARPCRVLSQWRQPQ